MCCIGECVVVWCWWWLLVLCCAGVRVLWLYCGVCDVVLWHVGVVTIVLGFCVWWL